MRTRRFWRRWGLLMGTVMVDMGRMNGVEGCGADSGEDSLCGCGGSFFRGRRRRNFIVTAAALSPVQSVIAADTGHINCHEAASIENTGHKILELPNTDGKISAEQIAACAAAYYEGGEPEYLTEPKMVYLSFPTEQGNAVFAAGADEDSRGLPEV